MPKWLALLVMVFSLPATAATIETKYFSLTLPESFHQDEKNKNKVEGKIFVSASKKQFVMLEYINKEYGWSDDPANFDRLIEEENEKIDEMSAKNAFRGIKLEQQNCPEACEAYYRENRGDINYANPDVDLERDAAPTSIYQYFYKNENTMVFFNYVDGVNDAEVSREIMQGFIEQIRHSTSLR